MAKVFNPSGYFTDSFPDTDAMMKSPAYPDTNAQADKIIKVYPQIAEMILTMPMYTEFL